MERGNEGAKVAGTSGESAAPAERETVAAPTNNGGDESWKPLPYAKRIQLSVLFQVPLDGTMAPGYLAAIAAPSQAPQGQPQGSAPPMSAMTADVTLGARTATGLDTRGAR